MTKIIIKSHILKQVQLYKYILGAHLNIVGTWVILGVINSMSHTTYII